MNSDDGNDAWHDMVDSDTVTESDEDEAKEDLLRQLNEEVHVYERALDGSVNHRRKYVSLARNLKPKQSRVQIYQVNTLLFIPWKRSRLNIH